MLVLGVMRLPLVVEKRLPVYQAVGLRESLMIPKSRGLPVPPGVLCLW